MYPFPDYHHIHQLVIINFRSAILSTLMSIATSYIILFVSPFPRAVSVKYQHRVCNLVSLHISDHHYNFTVSSFGQSVTIIKATLAHEQRHSKLSTSFLLKVYRITQPPWPIFGMVGWWVDDTFHSVHFCVETKNYNQDINKFIVRACISPLLFGPEMRGTLSLKFFTF